MEKACLECERFFYVKPSKSNKSKFCSRNCYNQHHQKHPEIRRKMNAHLSKKESIACTTCGNPLFRKQSITKENNFCNRKCMQIYRKKIGINSHLKKRITQVCKQCGNAFEIIESRKNTAKFCSRNCAGKANGERSKVVLRKRIRIACENCGCPIDRKPSEIFLIMAPIGEDRGGKQGNVTTSRVKTVVSQKKNLDKNFPSII